MGSLFKGWWMWRPLGHYWQMALEAPVYSACETEANLEYKTLTLYPFSQTLPGIAADILLYLFFLKKKLAK